jgi:hypothetical protein
MEATEVFIIIIGYLVGCVGCRLSKQGLGAQQSANCKINARENIIEVRCLTHYGSFSAVVNVTAPIEESKLGR